MMKISITQKELWTILLSFIHMYDQFGDHDLDTASQTNPDERDLTILKVIHLLIESRTNNDLVTIDAKDEELRSLITFLSHSLLTESDLVFEGLEEMNVRALLKKLITEKNNLS